MAFRKKYLQTGHSLDKIPTITYGSLGETQKTSNGYVIEILAAHPYFSPPCVLLSEINLKQNRLKDIPVLDDVSLHIFFILTERIRSSKNLVGNRHHEHFLLPFLDNYNNNRPTMP